ncbi:hypothetical protein RFI_32678 [Reticulomyxa filosa]|uniref:Uncharacterized protein n=1 Tax=Reticulomyxa filosa TaxID=46433 RepID=X6LS42_RETFI|nr:hypothetical protein RFI_32678 [Reticulomyxa filosa]|eukprot:ETO04718.1 hypothetical protein RFI_32678 [Reticulomyxa filosa]
MRRSGVILSCDVSWISPFKHEREILFARSKITSVYDEKTHKEQYAWNAKVESEDEYTQMILLTWTRYDHEMWNHSIDFNIIYIAIKYYCKGDINQTFNLLFEFEQWKLRYDYKQNYKETMNEFLEGRCAITMSIYFVLLFLKKINYQQQLILQK